ncbi:MAG: 2OG-Fe(II) oxygenase family protein [Pseudomonadota bacterium]
MFEASKSDIYFGTPLARYMVEDKEMLNDALLGVGHKLRAESEGVQKSNRGGWHSEGNLFKEDDDSIRHLKMLAGNAVFDCTKRLKGKTDPATLNLRLSAWMNINYANAYNAPHTHPGAHWSGVYYVKQPDVDEGNSGMIEFLDPRSDLPNWRILGVNAFRPKRKIRPKAGEIVLFPSYLVHWVYPNATDDERVTIAFNATFSKKKS